MLRAKIHRLEDELEVEQKLKYHWADRKVLQDRTEMMERVKEMKKRYK